MTTAIGVVMTEHIVAGRLENHQLAGDLLRYPVDTDESDALAALPGSELVEMLADLVLKLAGGGADPVDAIGIAVPGVIRHGVVEDSPNLTQIKGMRLGDELGKVLTGKGINAPVYIANDADAIAAGVAATRGQVEQAHARLDDRQRHRLRTLALCGRRLGGRPCHGNARPQGEVLRLRRRGTPGRHHGASGDAIALSRHGAGGDLRAREGRRCALPRVR